MQDRLFINVCSYIHYQSCAALLWVAIVSLFSMINQQVKTLIQPARHQYQDKRIELLEVFKGKKHQDDSRVMLNFLSTPMPDLNMLLKDIKILSVDFETTGLDSISDKLLSVGFVSMGHKKINLCSGYHQIINVKQRLDDNNVCIHTITEQESQKGKALKLVVDELLAALTGKVMLVHFNKIEREFLTRVCFEIYGVEPLFPIIDTLQLGNKALIKKGHVISPNDLTLSNLRQHYDLPSYTGHHALSDAIATAELFLVLMAERDFESLTLKDVIV